MTFANPAFLWGLLALAIPIVIHLFNFRQTKRLIFPSTRFLKEVKESTKKRRKIKEWLILAARCLFLAFLVLAFAGPERKGAASEQSGEVVVFLDNSISMEGEFASGIKKFDQAVKLAQNIINSYPETYRFQVFTQNLPYRPGFLQSAGEALDELASAETQFVSGSPFQFMIDYLREAGNQKREVFVISDFQKSSESPLPADSLQVLRLVSIESTEGSNAYVDSVYLSGPFLIKGANNSLTVRIANSGQQDSGDIPVRFLVNGETQGSSSVTIPAEGFAEVEFPISGAVEEDLYAQIVIDDFPNTYDNTFHLVLSPVNRISVAVIENPTTLPYLRSVYGNADLFDLQVFPPGNIDYTAIDQANLLVLNEIPSITGALASAINNRLQAGGATLLIPSAETANTGYENIAGWSARLSPVASGALSFAVPDIESPYFSGVFSEMDDNLELPTARVLYNLNPSSQVILRLRNGAPFFTASGTENKLLVMASPLSGEFSTLPRHALFVPLMYRVATLSRNSASDLYARTDSDLIRITIPKEIGNTIVKLKSELLEITPDQRISGNELVISTTEGVIIPGIYQVMANDEYLGMLAFNLPKSESILQYFSKQELEQLGGLIKNFDVTGTRELATFEKELTVRFTGFPLWKYALLIAIGFLIAELLIIRLLR